MQRLVFLAAGSVLGMALGCGQGAGPGGGSQAGGSSSPSQGKISTGAQLGYTWNSGDSSIRPVLGVAGASRLGSAVGPAPGAYVTAAITNASGAALLQDSKGNVSVMQLPSGEPQTLARGISAPLQFAFSRTGNYAVGYASGLAQVMVVSGLPSSPAATMQNVSAGLLAASISDDGSLLLALSSGAGGVTVSVAGAKQAVAQLGGFGGFAFLPGIDTAAIADSAANTLLLAKNVSTAPSVQAVPLAAGLLVQPFAVASSADGRWIFAANHADNSVVRVDLTNAIPAVKIPCPTPLTQLVAWNGNAAFALTNPVTGPSWILSATVTNPRVLFVPALASSGEAK
jgi:hypothetical protein